LAGSWMTGSELTRRMFGSAVERKVQDTAVEKAVVWVGG
jgi:hypothetical protein